MGNDNDPKFMAEFYKNLKILSQDLYKKSAVAQTNFRGGAAATNPSPQRRVSRQAGGGPAVGPGGLLASNSRASFLGLPEGQDAMSSAALAAAAFGETVSVKPMAAESAFQTHPENYFTADALLERMKMYASQGGIPLDYIERYAQTNKGHPQT